MCFGIFQNDGVNRGEVETIVDSFPGQSIDFFGAMRARVYDDKVRHAQAQKRYQVLCCLHAKPACAAVPVLRATMQLTTSALSCLLQYTYLRSTLC